MENSRCSCQEATYIHGLKESAMPSPTYKLFERAMRGGQQIVCMYDGHRRELSPIILGHSQDQEKALTFQFGGSSGQDCRAADSGAASGLPRSATSSFAM